MQAAVINVRAHLVSQRRVAPRKRAKRMVTGFIVTNPEVGFPLVIYEIGRDNRITTSAVRRVLEEGPVLWVETRNSVYKLVLAH